MLNIFKATSGINEALLELRETNSGYSAYIGSNNGPDSKADENISILLDKRTINFIDKNYGIVKLLNEIQKKGEKNQDYINGESYLKKNLTALIKQKFDELVEESNDLDVGSFSEDYEEEDTEDSFILRTSEFVLDTETFEGAKQIAKFNHMNFDYLKNSQKYEIRGYKAQNKAKELYQVLKGELELTDCKYLLTDTKKIYVHVDLVLDTETETEGKRIAKLNGLELTLIPEGEYYIIGPEGSEDKAYKLLDVLKGDLEIEHSTLKVQ